MATQTEPVTTEPTGALFRALRSVDVEPNLAYEAAAKPGRTSSPHWSPRSTPKAPGSMPNFLRLSPCEAVECDHPGAITGNVRPCAPLRLIQPGLALEPGIEAGHSGVEPRDVMAFADRLRSSSERSPNGEVVRKPLYGGPWIGYPVRARTAKKEILA